jgi:hemoglobin/transferrin/lactoferrin receptor protein
MMRRIFVAIAALLMTISSIAQQVRVLERGTNLPIENVTIYNDADGSYVFTDRNGFADLSGFADTSLLSFNHLSYIGFKIMKRELAVVEYQVSLTKRAEQLDEVVLSASRSKEKRSRIAEQVAVTSAAEIKMLAPQTSADLLAEMPGVRVQKSQFGGGSPVLRGMEANRVLLVVDGVRMNNAIYRMGHLQNSITVSPNIVERTEVIFGPSSVIYGSDALGGVIHYYTRTPKTSDSFEIEGSVFARFSSVNDEFTKEGNLEIRTPKWASYTSISHSTFSDLRMGSHRAHGYEDWGKVFEYSDNTSSRFSGSPKTNQNPDIQRNTGHSQTDLLQKFMIPVKEKNELVLNLQYSSSSEIDRFDKLTEYSDGSLKFAEWHYGPQKRLLLSGRYAVSPGLKWMERGTITAAYQKIEESRIQRKFGSLERSYREENVDVWSLNGDFFVPLSEDDDRLLSYGFEFTYNDVDSKAVGKELEVFNNTVVGYAGNFNVQSRYPDGGSDYQSQAAYINYRQDIDQNSTLNTGIRLVNTQLSARWIDQTFIQLPDNDISVNNTALTATAGYVHKPDSDWQLNAVISSGFRSPNIDDIGKVREKSGNVTVPNVRLRPEYAYSAETGALRYFNDRTFYAGLNFYYTLLDNYIVRDFFELNNTSTVLYDDELGNMVANVNKGTAYITGGTFNFKGSVNGLWHTRGSLTMTKGKAYDTKLPLSSIPPLFGFLELGVGKDRLRANLNWKFNGKKKRSDYNVVEGIDNIEQTPFDTATRRYLGNPAWNTVNLNAHYKVNNNASIYMHIDNIFDVHYKEFASSISAPGRNVSVTLLLKV